MRFPSRFLFLLLSVLAVSLAVLGGSVLNGPTSAQAASSATLKVQVIDGDGVPVRDAVVEIRPAGASHGPITFPWRMGMAQRDRRFVPGTLVIARGSTVAFPNLDRVRHSIYSFSKAARFEFDLYGRDQTRTHTFPKVGSVKLGCNIHDDMRGYIRVTDTPFAGTSDHNGYITLKAMPVGRAQITVWHPGLRAPSNEFSSAIALAAGSRSRKINVKLR